MNHNQKVLAELNRRITRDKEARTIVKALIASGRMTYGYKDSQVTESVAQVKLLLPGLTFLKTWTGQNEPSEEAEEVSS